MRHWNHSHYAISGCVTAALLASCGGPQPPINAPGVTPQALRLSASYQQVYLFHPPTDGTHPEAGLLEVNGTLYGTTSAGGLRHRGTVYRISTSGVQKVLHRFRGSDGLDPEAGLLDVNGTLYGTTNGGGGTGCYHGFGCGTVYSVSTSGKEKVLYAFQGGSDGAGPGRARLIAVKGTLYGTTPGGGGSGCETKSGSGCGTVFSLTTSGQETVLHHFTGGSDGAYPSGTLIDVNGVLYGVTDGGGRGSCYDHCGTVFSITPAGVEKVVYAFQGGSDGFTPNSGLTNVNGKLYGTTVYGGTEGSGTVYSISTAGAEKIVYSFAGGTDGANPAADLIDVDGVLYGTTTAGGDSKSPCIEASGCGTVFSVTTGGIETVLYRFVGGKDGFYSLAPLTNVNGTLYGTTNLGGDHDVCCHVYGYGTVFAVTP